MFSHNRLDLRINHNTLSISSFYNNFKILLYQLIIIN
jgi:hypothetical protein